MAEIIDLTEEPESALALAALSAIRERLAPGVTLRLRTRGDPELLFVSLNVQLRDALAWEKAAVANGWEATVKLAADGPPADVFALLKREHRVLDELLGRALRRLNAGDSAAAWPLLQEFAARLRRHAAAENDLLAPMLGGQAPLEAMLRDHEELLAELEPVEECFAAGMPEAWEVEPFVALLSGTLAKHEQREEQTLFPGWSARFAALGRADQRSLYERVMRALAD